MSDRAAAVYGLLRHCRPIVLSSARVVESGVRDRGWTVGTRAVVEVLAEAGPLTVPQLASRLLLARQNIQRHVDDLIRLGHARSCPNPAHRRSVLIELTEPGLAAFREIRGSELQQLATLVVDCTDEELAIAERVLAALERDISGVAP